MGRLEEIIAGMEVGVQYVHTPFAAWRVAQPTGSNFGRGTITPWIPP